MATAGHAAPAASDPKVERTVELDWQTYRLLRDDLDDPPTQAEGPHAAFRRVTLRPRPGGDPAGVAVHATWQIRADRAGFVAGLLTGPSTEIDSVTVDRRPAPVIRTPAGALLVAYVQRDAVIVLDAHVPAPITATGGDLTLALLPAVRGAVTLDSTDLLLEATSVPNQGGLLRSEGTLWSGAGSLDLRLQPPTSPDEQAGPLAVAHAGLGVTVGEGEVKMQARVVWTMRRGTLDALSIAVDGLGDDLAVSGRDVAKWNRNGKTIAIELNAPISTRAEVMLQWSQPLTDTAEATFALPSIQPQAAFRADATLQLARDGEIEVVPEVGNWSALAAVELPTWGQGLVEGTPTAAYQRGRITSDAGSLSLLRFVPVSGPAAVVDVAAYTIALTEDGRMLGLAKYQVRNERAAFLRVDPPPGVTIIGARIAGETALPGRTADGAWLIPLKRSLETVQGLLSFPVELTLLGDAEQWSRKEQRGIELPRLDAPIAASRVTMYLPPRYRSKLEAGDGAVVEEFTEGEGITYGLGLDDEQTAEADALVAKAVDDYRAGNFGAAQEGLDELESMGASNVNVDRLQSNLDLVTGSNNGPEKKQESKNDTALARRVREQAKARASEEFERQYRLEQEAEDLYRSGEYEEAEKAYEQAIVLGDKLENLEQKESVETQQRNVSLKGKLGELKAVKRSKASQGVVSKQRTRWASRVANRRAARAGRSRSLGSKDAKLPAGTAAPTSGAEVDQAAFAGGDDGTIVYDFDESELSGESQLGVDDLNTRVDDSPADASVFVLQGADLRPESARLDAERPPELDRRDAVSEDSAATVTPDVTGSPEADEPEEPEPEPEPESEPASPMTVRASASFVMVKDSAARRRPLAGVISGIRGIASRGRGRLRGRKVGKKKSKRAAPERRGPVSFSTASPAPPPDVAEQDGDAAAEGEAMLDFKAPIERLAAPEATASAVSVVIPAIGERIRYQTLLIEAGQAQVIPIDARRRLRRR